MGKKSRIEIPQAIAAQVLFAADRTCCVCREKRRQVQIHHIDENPANNTIENLSVLCLECHHATQIRGGFDRKLDAAQIALYRDDWLKFVASKRSAGKDSEKTKDYNKNKGLHFVQLKEASEEFLYSFEAEFPEIETSNSISDTETNSHINAFIEKTLSRFRSFAVSRKEEKNQIRKSKVERYAWDDMSVSHKLSLFTFDLLSVEFRIIEWIPMNFHPNAFTRTLNFRLTPPMQLELWDIFQPKSNYLEILSDYCTKDLHKQQPSRWHDSEERARYLKNNEDSWILAGACRNPNNFENFTLVSNGICVFFDPYQVGSYAEGRYEVFIPLSILKDVLDKTIAEALID
jgi:Protein of unknown function (DUF3298)